MTTSVYVAADVEDTVDLRVAALALVLGPDQIVCDRTAAWVHDIDVLTYGELDVLPPIETCVLPGGVPCKREAADGHTRDLSSGEIMTIGAIRVTTPLRTALDLGAILQRADALAALDAFRRRHGLTVHQLTIGCGRFRRRRGVIQLRELIVLSDPRSESFRESWTRLAIHDAGLPAPEPQVWIQIDGIPTYRLDLAYRRRRIAVEYDGWEAHERTPEQRKHDNARRKWLRDNGWTVIVVRSGDFTGEALDRWITELREALRAAYSNRRPMERGARSRRR